MNSLYENIAESLWTSCLNEDIGSAQWYISHLSEKALFGSMSSSMKKWTKQINQLEIEIAAFDGVRTTPKNVQAAIDQWKKSAEALTAKINDPDFQSAMKAVDKAFNISSKVGTANLSNGVTYDYAPSTYGPELNDFFKS